MLGMVVLFLVLSAKIIIFVQKHSKTGEYFVASAKNNDKTWLAFNTCYITRDYSYYRLQFSFLYIGEG